MSDVFPLCEVIKEEIESLGYTVVHYMTDSRIESIHIEQLWSTTYATVTVTKNPQSIHHPSDAPLVVVQSTNRLMRPTNHLLYANDPSFFDKFRIALRTELGKPPITPLRWLSRRWKALRGYQVP